MKRCSFPRLVLILQYFCLKLVQSVSEDKPFSGSRCDHSCFSVVVEILKVVDSIHSAGQALVSYDWFHSVNHPYSNTFHEETKIPWLVYGKTMYFFNIVA